VTVQNSQPGAAQVVIEPEQARTGEDLTCRVAVPSIDPDGDEVGYTWSWWRNGKLVPGASGPILTPAPAAARGDRFKCSATPGDGAAQGPAAFAERVIVNSPPGPARPVLVPARPMVGRPVRCELASVSQDPDGDQVRYRYRWQRNGALQPFAETSTEVPVRMVRAGDLWRCLVVPTDGDLEGPESGSEEGLVADSP